MDVNVGMDVGMDIYLSVYCGSEMDGFRWAWSVVSILLLLLFSIGLCGSLGIYHVRERSGERGV